MPEQLSETITLHAAGAIPGIAGEHAPGTYTVDYTARTITPLVETQEVDGESIADSPSTSDTIDPRPSTPDDETQTYAATHSGEEL